MAVTHACPFASLASIGAVGVRALGAGSGHATGNGNPAVAHPHHVGALVTGNTGY